MMLLLLPPLLVLLQLLGLGTALLENVDPNPENYVCAGVIQTKSQQVGCLLRLEPNAQAQVQPLLPENQSVSRLQNKGPSMRVHPASFPMCC